MIDPIKLKEMHDLLDRANFLLDDAYEHHCRSVGR